MSGRPARIAGLLAAGLTAALAAGGARPAAGEAGPTEEWTSRELIDSILDPSYLGLGGGVHLGGGVGEFDDLLFEAEIHQHLHVFGNKDHGNWMLLVDPMIQLRMYTEESWPVKTPGFLPRVSYYRWFGKGSDVLGRNVLSATLSHHSNGQAGEFYGQDGRPNLDGGSFETNFLELSYQRLFRPTPARARLRGEDPPVPSVLRATLRWHPGFGRSDELDGQYEEVKLLLDYRTTDRQLGASPLYWEMAASLACDVAGRDWVVAPNPDHPELEPDDAGFGDRLGASARLMVRHERWQDLTLMLRWENTLDYYNIHFQERLHRLTFGIAGDPLRMIRGSTRRKDKEPGRGQPKT